MYGGAVESRQSGCYGAGRDLLSFLEPELLGAGGLCSHRTSQHLQVLHALLLVYVDMEVLKSHRYLVASTIPERKL